jgi:hypothetical protein
MNASPNAKESPVFTELDAAHAHDLLYPRQIDALVLAALDRIAPGSRDGLQGLSCEDDGVTYALWNQALYGAENALSFLEGFDPQSMDEYLALVADRVAQAILAINFFTDAPVRVAR